MRRQIGRGGPVSHCDIRIAGVVAGIFFALAAIPAQAQVTYLLDDNRHVAIYAYDGVNNFPGVSLYLAPQSEQNAFVAPG